jgi:prolyl-tRNA editing enzyme YbaK/EbsC (Cys-tRNA(Pro) deacylase)
MFVARSEPMTTFLDRDLFRLEQIWAAASTPNAVFRLTPADLQAMTAAEVVPIN